jgi:replication-associated recombination protein RarA
VSGPARKPSPAPGRPTIFGEVAVVDSGQVLDTRRRVREAAGQRRICVISGPSGAGKTTAAVDAVARAAAELGMRHERLMSSSKPGTNELSTRCIEAITRSASPAASGFRLADYLVELLRAEPTILVIDEAHRFGKVGLEHVQYIWEHHRSCFVLVGTRELNDLVERNETIASRTDKIRLHRPEGAELRRIVSTFHPALAAAAPAATRKLEMAFGTNLHHWRRAVDKLDHLAELAGVTPCFEGELLDAVCREVA